MRAVMLIAFSICIFTVKAEAQPEFEWYDARAAYLWDWPTSTAIASDSVLFVAGGNLCRSLDGGMSWEVAIERAQTATGFSSVYFVDDSVGFVSPGNSARSFYRTTDGGHTWTEGQMNYDQTGPMVANDSLHIYTYCNDSRVHYSTDGGSHWHTSTSNFSGYQFRDIFAVDSMYGFLLLSHSNGPSRLYGTSNAGQNWAFISTINVGNGISFDRDADFFDHNIGFIVEHYNIFRTINGGVEWDSVRIDSIWGPLRRINAVSDSVIVAFTKYGVLLKSSDQGENWRAFPIHQVFDLGEQVYESSIQFRDSLRGVVFVHYGEAYLTSDGGVSWNHFDSKARSNFAKLVAGQQFLWVLDDENTVWRGRFQRPDGELFRRYSIPTQISIRSICSTSDDVACVVGDSGAIFLTEDGGRQWTQVQSPTTVDLNDVIYADWAGLFFACGDSGTLISSPISGNSWVVVHDSGDEALNALFTSSYWYEMLCVGDNGKVLIWDQAEWRELESPTTNRLRGGHAAQGDLTIYGDDGTWHYTENNGASWATSVFTEADITGYRTLSDYYSSYGLAVCSNGEYFCPGGYCNGTVDRGFSDLIYLDRRFIACGDSGLLVQGPDGYYFDAREPAPFPQSYSLSVFPNPFNSTATLQFELPRESRAEIILYDVLGREAMRLADDIFSAGTHQLSVEAGALASGVYFANLRTPEFSTTTKLLLLR